MVAQFQAENYNNNCSPEAYFNLEENSEFRNEYINGKIKPMTGFTPNHNAID